jgi:hypothetical protein
MARAEGQPFLARDLIQRHLPFIDKQLYAFEGLELSVASLRSVN